MVRLYCRAAAAMFSFQVPLQYLRYLALVYRLAPAMTTPLTCKTRAILVHRLAVAALAVAEEAVFNVLVPLPLAVGVRDLRVAPEVQIGVAVLMMIKWNVGMQGGLAIPFLT